MTTTLEWILYVGGIAVAFLSLAPLFTAAPPAQVAMAVIGSILFVVSKIF